MPVPTCIMLRNHMVAGTPVMGGSMCATALHVFTVRFDGSDGQLARSASPLLASSRTTPRTS